MAATYLSFSIMVILLNNYVEYTNTDSSVYISVIKYIFPKIYQENILLAFAISS